MDRAIFHREEVIRVIVGALRRRECIEPIQIRAIEQNHRGSVRGNVRRVRTDEQPRRHQKSYKTLTYHLCLSSNSPDSGSIYSAPHLDPLCL